MSTREKAVKLLAKLKEHGIDPQEVLEVGSAYLVQLGLYSLDPGNEELRRKLQEAEGPEELGAILDQVNAKAEEALKRYGFAGELLSVLGKLLNSSGLFHRQAKGLADHRGYVIAVDNLL